MTRGCWVGIVFCALLLSSCETKLLRQTPPDPDAETPTFRAARERFELRDFDGAIRLYHEVLRENPEMARAHFNLGLIYDERKADYISAIYHYTRFLQLKPESREAAVVAQWIRRAELAFAAQLPNSPIENKEEFTRLQRDNMHMQAELLDTRRRLEELERKLTAANARAAQLEQRLAAASATPRPAPQSAPALQSQQTSVPPSAPASDSQQVVSVTPSRLQPASSRRHIVQQGETLFSIARSYYPDRPSGEAVRIILEANSAVLPDANRLRSGMTLVIP